MPSDVFRPRLPIDPFANIQHNTPWRIPADLQPSPPQVIFILGEPTPTDLAPLLNSPLLATSLVLIATHTPVPLPPDAQHRGPAIRILRLAAPLHVHDTGALRLVGLFERAQRVAAAWRNTLSPPRILHLAEDPMGEFTPTAPPDAEGRYPSPAPSISSAKRTTAEAIKNRLSLLSESLSLSLPGSTASSRRNSVVSIASSESNSTTSSQNGRPRSIMAATLSQLTQSLANYTTTPASVPASASAAQQRAFDAIVNFLPGGNVPEKALFKHAILLTTLSAQYLALPHGAAPESGAAYHYQRRGSVPAPVHSISSATPPRLSLSHLPADSAPPTRTSSSCSLSASASGSTSASLAAPPKAQISTTARQRHHHRRFSSFVLGSSSSSSSHNSTSISIPDATAFASPSHSPSHSPLSTPPSENDDSRASTPALPSLASTALTTPARELSSEDLTLTLALADDYKAQPSSAKMTRRRSLSKRISTLFAAVTARPASVAGTLSLSGFGAGTGTGTGATADLDVEMEMGVVRRDTATRRRHSQQQHQGTRTRTRTRTRPQNAHIVHVLAADWRPAPCAPATSPLATSSTSSSSSSLCTSLPPHGRGRAYTNPYPSSGSGHGANGRGNANGHGHGGVNGNAKKPRLVQGIEQFLLSFAYPVSPSSSSSSSSSPSSSPSHSRSSSSLSASASSPSHSHSNSRPQTRRGPASGPPSSFRQGINSINTRPVSWGAPPAPHMPPHMAMHMPMPGQGQGHLSSLLSQGMGGGAGWGEGGGGGEMGRMQGRAVPYLVAPGMFGRVLSRSGDEKGKGKEVDVEGRQRRSWLGMFDDDDDDQINANNDDEEDEEENIDDPDAQVHPRTITRTRTRKRRIHRARFPTLGEAVLLGALDLDADFSYSSYHTSGAVEEVDDHVRAALGNLNGTRALKQGRKWDNSDAVGCGRAWVGPGDVEVVGVPPVVPVGSVSVVGGVGGEEGEEEEVVEEVVEVVRRRTTVRRKGAVATVTAGEAKATAGTNANAKVSAPVDVHGSTDVSTTKENETQNEKDQEKEKEVEAEPVVLDLGLLTPPRSQRSSTSTSTSACSGSGSNSGSSHEADVSAAHSVEGAPCVDRDGEKEGLTRSNSSVSRLSMGSPVDSSHSHSSSHAHAHVHMNTQSQCNNGSRSESELASSSAGVSQVELQVHAQDERVVVSMTSARASVIAVPPRVVVVSSSSPSSPSSSPAEASTTATATTATTAETTTKTATPTSLVRTPSSAAARTPSVEALEKRLLSAGNDAGVGSAWVAKATGPPPPSPGVGVGDESEKNTASSSGIAVPVTIVSGPADSGARAVDLLGANPSPSHNQKQGQDQNQDPNSLTVPTDTITPSRSSSLRSRLSVKIGKARMGLNAGLNTVSSVTATVVRPAGLVREQTKAGTGMGMGMVVLGRKGKGKGKGKGKEVDGDGDVVGESESEVEAEGASTGVGKRETVKVKERERVGRRDSLKVGVLVGSALRRVQAVGGGTGKETGKKDAAAVV
ncbi:hypothetical protein JR316_0008822 [Psilocybe cubensis]|nr:hypothetical protein JR316_0008822 [Psilocybe cubensis]KAH9478368.1 hypothetical protein JR316_0008822 [Psilocybe cubensis]